MVSQCANDTATFSASFGIVDNVLFAIALLVSLWIGIYYAIRPGKSGTENFLMGGRKLPLVPTAVSLLCSFVSGIAILSYPELIYRQGAAFAWSAVGAVLALIFTGFVILPVLYPLQYVNFYQYFEERFDARPLRYYGDGLFILATIMYSGVVLYVPCKALSGITILPMYAIVLVVGLACGIYTTIGGIKAVIWTDTFQGFVMYAGILALLVRGFMSVGVKEFGTLVYDGGRLDGLWNVDIDPFQYMTVWTATFGGMLYWLGAFGASQIALQRYCSLPSLKRAQIVACVTMPGIFIVFSLTFLIGLVMYASYAGRDPGIGKDKMVIKYMLSTLDDAPGLPGLFMAGVLSGTLSSVSSGINSLAAVTWNDFISQFFTRSSPRMQGFVTKLISGLFSLLIIGAAFTVEPLGDAMSALLSCLGALGGPAVGMVMLGLLVPWADDVGAYLGVIGGSIFNLVVLAGKVKYGPSLIDPLPVVDDCCDSNSTIQCHYTRMLNITSNSASKDQLYGFQKLSSMSNLMLPLTGALITVIVGSVVSAVTRRSNVAKDRPHLVFWTRKRTLPVMGYDEGDVSYNRIVTKL